MLGVLENQGALNKPWVSIYIWQINAFLYALVGYFILLNRLRYAEKKQNRMQAEALFISQQSEQRLKDGIAERTADLEQARAVLETTLASERRMRLEQRQFTAMVTHELRTPLAVIDSAAFNLEQLFKNVPERYLRQIRQAVQRIVHLIENCLAEDRLHNSGFTVQPRRVSLGQLIDEAAEIVSWSTKHQLIKQLDELPKIIEADSTLLRIALSNLLDNAVKYAIPGSIVISSEIRQSVLILSVCDNGPGIDSAELESIFNRYYQVNTNRGGVGLGLFITRTIAQLHGGDLSVSPSPQGGCCFHFSMNLLP